MKRSMAIGINVVAIVCWCFMNPNRESDHALSPAEIRTRFIAMITVYSSLLAGAIGYNLVTGYQKNKAKAAQEQAAPSDVNRIEDSNSPNDPN